MNSSFFIAICSFFLTASTYQMWNKPVNTDKVTLVFFATLFIYNLARALPLMLDKQTLLLRQSWFRNNRTYILVLVIFTGLVVVYESRELMIGEIVFLLHLGVISALYSFPMGWLGIKPLRNLPYVKIFLIAYVWGAVCVGFPAVGLGYPLWSSEVLLSAGSVVLFIFAITIPFDIRDARSDQDAALKTLPHRVGLKNALMIATIILLISSGISVYQTPDHWWSEAIVFFLTAGLINYSSGERPNWYFLGLIDGTIILKSMIAFL